MKTMNDLLDRAKQKLKGRQADRDAQILWECQRGDLIAFETLVRTYRPLAMRIAMGYLRHAEDAVDCSQDAFVQVLEALPRFDLSKPFFPWFYGIVRHACLKRLRRIRQRRETPLESIDDKIHESGRNSFDHGEAVQQALLQLSEDQQEVIILRHWENLSYEAIAAATQTPLGTVMSRLHYARERLSKLLKGVEPL